MGLGPASTIVASNVLLVLLIAVTIVRLMRLVSIPRASLSIEGSWVFPAAISLVLATLAVQTSFYIAARFLKTYEITNLWAAHPAPALISLVLAFSVYWVMPPYFRAIGFTDRQVKRRCAAELAALALLWILFQRALV